MKDTVNEVIVRQEWPDKDFYPAINVKIRTFGDELRRQGLAGMSEEELDAALAYAWEEHSRIFWACARDMAREVLGPEAEVCQVGRSGGWLIVRGLEEPAGWDEAAKARWYQFEAAIMALVAALCSTEEIIQTIKERTDVE